MDWVLINSSRCSWSIMLSSIVTDFVTGITRNCWVLVFSRDFIKWGTYSLKSLINSGVRRLTWYSQIPTTNWANMNRSCPFRLTWMISPFSPISKSMGRISSGSFAALWAITSTDSGIMTKERVSSASFGVNNRFKILSSTPDSVSGYPPGVLSS